MFPPEMGLTFLKQIMATEKNLQNYELMAIFTPVLSDEDYKNAQKKFTDFVNDNGGNIVHQNAWGLRPLAYPIQKKTTGLYFVMEFQAPSEANAKLEIQMNRDETIIRHMITRLDKFSVAYNLRQRSKHLTADNA